MSKQQPDDSSESGRLPKRNRLTRRRFMVRAAWITGVIMVLGAQLWIVLKLFFGSKSPDFLKGPIKVGPVDQFAIGSVTHFWKERFLLVRHPEEFIAFSQTCTHSKCNVDYLPDERVIFCPCHGARFSLSGAVLTGPAERPLDRFATTVSKGQVVVDVSRQLPS